MDLATRFNGEIINGDAMQMYDGLPIITNKITPEERQGIPHHLLGFVALDEEPWRVGLFKKKASKVTEEIRSRGRLPILVGGTHYYTQSLLFENSLVDEENEEGATPPNSEVAVPEQTFAILDGPTEDIIQKLREVDPVMADRWHPNERRKLRRSLEIYLTTGKRASDIYAEQKKHKHIKSNSDSGEANSADVAAGDNSTLLFWVHSDSDILKKRLDDRIYKMVETGLLEEVKAMSSFLASQREAGLSVDLSRGIWVSIGWKEFEDYLTALNSGSSSTEELRMLYELSIEKTQVATRQYAKQQIRWIRRKLITALSEAGQLEKLYLLDASDVSLWKPNASMPAIEITAKFLDGDAMPLPQEISSVSKEFLTPFSDEAVEESEFRQECELCHVTCVAEHQWLEHLKSRRHRALAKKKLKNIANGRSRKVDDSSNTEIS